MEYIDTVKFRRDFEKFGKWIFLPGFRVAILTNGIKY